MDFQDLYAFYHVATEGSFSKAGIRIRVAQSALSRRVARLEHVLRIPLLQRHGRGVRLTEQGTALLNRAKDLMDELEQIEQDVLLLAEEPIGKVRVAMPPMMSQVLAPRLVIECRRRFPGISLQLLDGFSDSIEEWIVENQADFGVMYHSGRDTDLRMEMLLTEPLFLLAPTDPGDLEPQVREEKISIARLAELPLILPSRPNNLRLVVDRAAAQHNVALNVILEVGGIHATKGLVAVGIGYSIFGNIGVVDDATEQAVRAIPFCEPLSWQLELVQQHRLQSTRAFTEVEHLIKEQIRMLVAEGNLRGAAMCAPA